MLNPFSKRIFQFLTTGCFLLLGSCTPSLPGQQTIHPRGQWVQVGMMTVPRAILEKKQSPQQTTTLLDGLAPMGMTYEERDWRLRQMEMALQKKRKQLHDYETQLKQRESEFNLQQQTFYASLENKKQEAQSSWEAEWDAKRAEFQAQSEALAFREEHVAKRAENLSEQEVSLRKREETVFELEALFEGWKESTERQKERLTKREKALETKLADYAQAIKVVNAQCKRPYMASRQVKRTQESAPSKEPKASEAPIEHLSKKVRLKNGSEITIWE